jgi:DNA-binding CsgD family transcriptional regulator/N-acetylneuraminic acid mutarotase
VIISIMDNSNQLSERELEILQMVATGASNKEIAQKLAISTNTVKVHLRNIFGKIDASSRTEASMWAVRNGLVTPFDNANLDGPTSPDQAASVAPSKTAPARRAFAIAGVIFVVTVVIWFVFRSQSAGAPPLGPQGEAQTTGISRWQSRESLPVGRNSPAVAAVDGLIYVIGGEGPQGITTRVDQYDPRSNSWTGKAPKPLPVTNARAAVIGGQIFVPGGELESGETTDVLEIYDPRLDAWEQGESLPEPRSAYALIAYEGRLYLFGGWDGEEARNEVYMYQPGSAAEPGRWLEMSPMPVPRASAGAAISGGRIYLMGGLSSAGQILTRSDVYTPVLDDGGENPWAEGMPLPEARAEHGMTSVGDLVFLIGGDGPGSNLLSNLQFFPAAGLWQRIENPVQSLWTGMGVISAGTQLYIFGGRIDGEISALTQTYQAVFTIAVPIAP